MALHEALEAVLREVAADILGTAVNAQGQLVTPPKVAQFFADYEQLQTNVGALQSQLAQALTTIDQLTTLLSGKASANALADVRQRVGIAENALLQKANTAYVDQQVQAIGGVDADQAAAISQIKQTLLGEGSQITTLLSTQASQNLLLDELRIDVNKAALASTVSALTGQVTVLRNTVNDASTGLAATKSLADTNAVEVAKRVLRTGDTMTGALNVIPPTTGQNALRLDNVPSGGNRPLREFIGATTTAIVGKDPGTGITTLTDPLSLGRAASLRYFGLVWKTLPLTSLVTIVTLSDQAGNKVLEKVYPIGTVYALGNLIDMLDLTASRFPEVASGTTLYLTTSQGKANANADFAFITPNSL